MRHQPPGVVPAAALYSRVRGREDDVDPRVVRPAEAYFTRRGRLRCWR